MKNLLHSVKKTFTISIEGKEILLYHLLGQRILPLINFFAVTIGFGMLYKENHHPIHILVGGFIGFLCMTLPYAAGKYEAQLEISRVLSHIFTGESDTSLRINIFIRKWWETERKKHLF
jgi:hypothetical protein